MTVRLTWRGPQVAAEVMRDVVGPAMAEIGLRVEGEAKHELRKGHGVLTGTLRRSIHAAGANYAYSGDNVEPGAGTPERGGSQPPAAETVTVGSGMRYALWVHQGHGSFGGYHYLTNAVDKVRPLVPGILRRLR